MVALGRQAGQDGEWQVAGGRWQVVPREAVSTPKGTLTGIVGMR